MVLWPVVSIFNSTSVMYNSPISMEYLAELLIKLFPQLQRAMIAQRAMPIVDHSILATAASHCSASDNACGYKLATCRTHLFIATFLSRGWQRSEGLLRLHIFLSSYILIAQSIFSFGMSAKSVSLVGLTKFSRTLRTRRWIAAYWEVFFLPVLDEVEVVFLLFSFGMSSIQRLIFSASCVPLPSCLPPQHPEGFWSVCLHTHPRAGKISRTQDTSSNVDVVLIFWHSNESKMLRGKI